MSESSVVARGSVQQQRRRGAGDEGAVPDSLEELCHDLRQPVAAILMLAAAAALESEVSDALRRRLSQIAAEAKWLADLLQVNREQDEPELVDLRDVVQDAVEAVAPAFDGTLRMEAADELPVMAPPIGMRRAVANVLDNAVRASGAGGAVEVRLATGTDVAVEVHDDGPGFGHVPVRNGLGLGITRKVVNACGGAVEVGNSHLGGSLVRLRLPGMPCGSALR